VIKMADLKKEKKKIIVINSVGLIILIAIELVLYLINGNDPDSIDKLTLFNSMFSSVLIISSIIILIASSILKKYKKWIRATLISFSLFAILALVLSGVINKTWLMTDLITLLLAIILFSIGINIEHKKIYKKERFKYD